MSGPAPIPDAELEAMERVAVDLARLAGAEIQGALGRTLAVRYKGADAETVSFRDPVSEVDQRAEALIRDRLAELYPRHGILGEEYDEKPGDPDACVWAVDPVDGTANFINGFPLFAACIGIVHRGVPVAGAIWCSTSHALRPGTYHARRGGTLRFDDERLERVANPAIRRRLAGEPDVAAASGAFDARKTGSAAIECAFVAAGLLSVARFAAPNPWDVAAGIVLVEAAGGRALTRRTDAADWAPFETFAPDAGDRLNAWRQPLLLGHPDDLATYTAPS